MVERGVFAIFSEWKKSIACCEGKYSLSQRERMFISEQTYEGLQISTNSVLEVTKYLLNSGTSFVLTEKFNQDALEEYFGRHRSLGRRNDNPSIYEMGYNCNTLRIQRSYVPVTGNTKGAHKGKRKVSWKIVDNTALKKRKAK